MQRRTAVLLTVLKKRSKFGFGLIMVEGCDFCVLASILWIPCPWRRLQQAAEDILWHPDRFLFFWHGPGWDCSPWRREMGERQGCSARVAQQQECRKGYSWSEIWIYIYRPKGLSPPPPPQLARICEKGCRRCKSPVLCTHPK